jgi:arylsulfatase A-like enzyme
MRKNTLFSLIAICILCGFGASVEAQTFSDDFESYPNGTDMAGVEARSRGWWVGNATPGVNDATVSDRFNSPFSAGGQAVKLQRTSVGAERPSLRNYFVDTSLAEAVSGSVGGSLSGSHIGFSWDWNRNSFSNPDFRIYDAQGALAIRLYVHAGSGHRLRYGSDGDPRFSSHAFKPDAWYRFELSNVNTTTSTYDIKVYEYGNEQPVLSASDVAFNESSAAGLSYWSLAAFSASSHTFYVDNFSVVPGELGVQLEGSASAVTRNGNESRPPNIIFIVMDDLNDSVEGFGGHPQTQTPNIDRLAETGVRFLNASVTVPLCGPSRPSFLTGLQPHTSGYFSTSSTNRLSEVWDVPVLAQSRTWVQYFSDHGYDVEVHGKVYHNTAEREQDRQSADGRKIIFDFAPHFGPYPYPESEDIRHPRTPYARGISSFGRLSDVPPGGWSLNRRRFRYESAEDRDLMPDEIYAGRAEAFLASRAASGTDRPFFLNVGFVRPHEPFIVPDEYFAPFPIEEVELSPGILEGDLQDASPFFWRNLLTGERIWNNYGFSRFRVLKEHGHLEEITQAYLASVFFADAMVGRVLTALENSPFSENTLVIVTSDNGYHIGEKEYFHKLTPWERSIRVPLVIAGPGVASGEVVSPVSLVDLFPTFMDFADLSESPHQHTPLDGHSLRPLLERPSLEQWTGPAISISAVPSHRNHPASFSEMGPDRPRNSVIYSARSSQFRYIIYPDGSEELYDMERDPHEWTNLANQPEYANVKESLKSQMESLVGIPLGDYFEPGSYTPR